MAPTICAIRRIVAPLCVLMLVCSSLAVLALPALPASVPVAHAAASTTVTSGADSGPGSLRQTIAEAAPGSTITFDPDVTTVTLTTAELLIEKSLTIQGGGVTIRRDRSAPRFRIFFIVNTTQPIRVTLENLAVTGGHTFDGVDHPDGGGGRGGYGGGFFIIGDSTVQIHNVAIYGNRTGNGGDGNKGGHGGDGGGIVVGFWAKVELQNSTVYGNQTGKGGYGENGGGREGNRGGNGGGIYNDGGTLTLTNTVVHSNMAGESGGATSGGGGYGGFGGGIYNKDTALTIQDSTIRDNRAGDSSSLVRGSYPHSGIGGFGGGIYNHSGTLTMLNTTVRGNETGQAFDVDSMGDGAGIANDGGVLTVESSTISHNKAGVGYGGGIYSENYWGPWEGRGTVSISDTLISHNQGAFGGGIEAYNIPVTVTNSIISNNEAGNAGGGVNSFVAPLTITNSTIRNNQSGYGGGISASTLTITNSLIYNNQADFGGGISAGLLTIANSIISGNATREAGGGIATGPLTMTNTTVSGNWAAAQGGGLVARNGPVRIHNSMLWGNAAPQGSQLYNSQRPYPRGSRVVTITVGFSLIEGGVTGPGIVLGANASLIDDGGNISDDPQFVSPITAAANPTADGDLRLQPSSPAIDAGDPAFDPDALPPPLTSDQRGPGFPRITDGDGDGRAVIDIGAYEFQPTQLSLSATDASGSEAAADPLAFTLTRRGDDMRALEVPLTIGGSATGGVDYTPVITSPLPLAANALSRTLTLTPIADQLAEGTETVVLTLEEGVGYTIDPDQRRATGTLTDAAPGVIIRQKEDSRTDGAGDAVAEYNVMLTSQPSAAVQLLLTPSDQVTVTPATLTFSPDNWNTPQVVTVQAVEDARAQARRAGQIAVDVISDDARYSGLRVPTVQLALDPGLYLPLIRR